jgi:hypothetical protein
MSPGERQLRSRLTQIVSGQGFIRGTILERQRACGNPRCKCATGEKHRAVYLMLREDGKLRQLYIPVAYEQRVREWVANQQEIKELLKQLGEFYWQQVKQRQG